MPPFSVAFPFYGIAVLITTAIEALLFHALHKTFTIVTDYTFELQMYHVTKAAFEIQKFRSLGKVFRKINMILTK